MSKAHKGKKYALGVKRSDAFKKNLSKKLKGRKKSQEHIRKGVESRKKGAGYKMKPESIDKIRKKLQGKNHYNWKGGHSSLVTKIRATNAYIKWRESVYKRDKYTCQNCGDNTGGNLEAHHIKPMSEILDDYKIKTVDGALNCKKLWETNNGQTLCNKCHKLTDTYGKNKRKKT